MKWQLLDGTIPHTQQRGSSKHGIGGATFRNQLYQAGFGMLSFDGTRSWKPKPVAHAMRFFSGHVLEANDRGKLTWHRLVLPNRAEWIGYVWRGSRRLICADMAYRSRLLSFRSPRPVIVFLDWSGDALRVMTTADVTVTLRPGDVLKYSGRPKIAGKFGKAVHGPDGVTLETLEGETVTVGR
jgi:hypothetical protein